MPDIRLYPGEASATDIILREAPAITVSPILANIILYSGEPVNADIRMRTQGELVQVISDSGYKRRQTTGHGL